MHARLLPCSQADEEVEHCGSHARKGGTMNEERQQIIQTLLGLLAQDENPDSIEISTPAKGGAIKVYGDFSKPEEFKRKIDAAIEARAYAQGKLGGQS